MKKLMIAVTIVCAAAFAQAGTVTWGSNYLNVSGGVGESSDYIDGGTVYLMSGSASAFFALAATDYDSAVASALAYATLSGEELKNPSTGTKEGLKIYEIGDLSGEQTLFMTMIDANNNIYISESVTDTVPLVGAKGFYFNHDAAYDGTTYALSGGYKDAGWYTAVPEPTSGLLLLLGVAGLALRRRLA